MSKITLDLHWVFVCKDGAKMPLQVLYHVMWQTRNCAVLKIGDKMDTMSFARVKPYLAKGEVEEAVLPHGHPSEGRCGAS